MLGFMMKLSRLQRVRLQRDTRARRLGFTLVELLVVVALLAVLMSLLLPALGRVREQAKGVKCLSNLRQLGVAAMAYANDNERHLPYQNPLDHSVYDYMNPTAPVNFARSLSRYTVPGAWLCPTVWIATDTLPAYAENERSDTNYQANGCVNGRRFSSIPRPGSTIYIQEVWVRNSWAWLRPYPDGQY